MPDGTTSDTLASGSYAERQKASLEMWGNRDQFRQLVQDAARDTDPEVALRANWILRRWRSGQLPGVVERENNSENLDPLSVALEAGAFSAVEIAVEESAGTIEFDLIRQRISRLLGLRFPIYAESAVRNSSENELLSLMWSVAIQPSMVIAAVDLSKQMGQDPTKLLAATLDTLDERTRHLTLTLLALRDQEFEVALAEAEKSGDQSAIRMTQMLTGRWDLVAAAAQDATRTANEPAELAEQYAWMLIGATRDGDPVAIETATQWLTQVKADDDALSQMIRWRALAINAKVGEAIDVIAEHDAALAARIAWVSNRLTRGFEMLEFPFNRLDQDLERWIEDAFKDQQRLPPGQIAPSIDRLYSLARLVYKVGRQDLAWLIYKRLSPREVVVGRYGESLRLKTLSELGRLPLERLEWVRDIAVEPGESPERGNAITASARALDVSSATFKLVYERIKLIHRRSGARDCFRMTFDLFRGVTPDQFDPADDLDQLFELLTRVQQLRRTRNGMAQVERVILNDSMIALFEDNGRMDLANRGRAMLVDSGKLDALIDAAEQAMERGDSALASDLWLRVGEQAKRFTATQTVITLDRGLSFAKATVGRWLLARRLGHVEEAARLRRVLELMKASPSMAFRKDLAEHFNNAGELRQAANLFKEIVIYASYRDALAQYGSVDGPDFFQTALGFVGCLESLNETDSVALAELGLTTNETARWYDLAVLDLFRNDQLVYNTIFVSIPLGIRKMMLEQALEADDDRLAARLVSEIEQFDPLDIDFGERVVPEIRQAGMNGLADDAFDRLFRNGLDYISIYGTDAMVLNNLAWTAAMNEREIEKAIELSERAVYLMPDSVTYRDTFAELLFQLGKIDQAIAVESACLLDEPDEWQLHEQIDKFQKAKSKAVAD